jgi:hypothetical protein
LECTEADDGKTVEVELVTAEGKRENDRSVNVY